MLDAIEKFNRALSEAGQRHVELAKHIRDDPPTLTRDDMKKVVAVGNQLIELQRISGQFLRCNQDALVAIDAAMEHLHTLDEREVRSDEVSRILDAEKSALRRLIDIIGASSPT